MTERISAGRFHEADGVDDWRCLYHLVSARFRTSSLAAGAAFADEVARLAGSAEEHLRLDLRPTGVTVSLLVRDVALARRISAVAARLGLPAEPAEVQLLNVAIDALVIADVLPFWEAVLGYRRIGDDYLADPAGRAPGFSFQRMDAPRPQRNRVHLDLAVPHDRAADRIAAALAAGGRLVTDEHAPKWWVLADPEGNEACVATWIGRE
ncbi:VOC family protein [Phytomonospora sp. NPDC050363]|uniref:VOC family protein n=1 Tax=Phytomonospora sp. NPDC050363 TaxID=3155642 RepID=UPI0033DFD997